MKERTLFIDGIKTNDYIRGRINGIVYALTRSPEKDTRSGMYPWRSYVEHPHVEMRFDATDEQFDEAVRMVEDLYPGIILLKKTLS